MRITGFTYKSAIYCHGCIIQQLTGAPGNGNVEDTLRFYANQAGIDWEDGYSFHSDDFPKVIFGYQVDNSETCDHCGDEL